MTAAALPVLQTHLPTSLADLTGLAAGIGIVLLARSPDGILGMTWLTEPGAPAVRRRATASSACLSVEREVARAA